MVKGAVQRILCGLVFLIIFNIHSSSAQSGKIDKRDSLPVKQIDMVDVINKLFRFHARNDSIKQKGKGPFISFAPVVGYSLVSGLTGAFVCTTSFYTDSTRNKLSNILLNGNYSQYHQYWFNLNSYIFFAKNKFHLFGDTRYYKFPTQTYGLGAESTFSDKLPIDFSYLRCYQILFRELKENIFAGIGYDLDYHWNITTAASPIKTLNEFEEFQSGDKSVSSGISLNLKYDNRNNSLNAQQGTFINLQYRSNLTALGSTENSQLLQFEIRHYLKLPAHSRNVLGFWNYNNIILHGNLPYLDLPSIGWDDYSNTGRGYIPGRYTGRNLIYFESEYRFVITRNGLLGGVVFANLESISDKLSDAPNSRIPGGGFGLRLKLNKFSNTNLAIDYGFGIEGSRGFFFNLGEVF